MFATNLHNTSSYIHINKSITGLSYTDVLQDNHMAVVTLVLLAVLSKKLKCLTVIYEIVSMTSLVGLRM